MPPVNGVGEPGAGEPHARFEVAGAGKGMTWPRSPGVAQPTGKPAEERPWALPSDIITSPAPDPTVDEPPWRQLPRGRESSWQGWPGSACRAGRRRLLRAESRPGMAASSSKEPSWQGNRMGTPVHEQSRPVPADPARSRMTWANGSAGQATCTVVLAGAGLQNQWLS